MPTPDWAGDMTDYPVLMAASSAYWGTALSNAVNDTMVVPVVCEQGYVNHVYMDDTQTYKQARAMVAPVLNKRVRSCAPHHPAVFGK